ncbi:MAG: CPBP family intramembrane metalloprotease [Ruminococcaceae bacterium]|nr:CPBP family intramembrane metalloprotease [Oscillospiraceae bacterium]
MKSKAAKQQKKPSNKGKTIVLQPTVVVLATYILLLLSKIIDLTLINRENEYFSVVILQMMIFLLPAAIWCRFSGESYISHLRLKLPSLSSIPLMLSAAVLMITGGLLLSVLFDGLDSLSSNFSLYDTFISKDNGTVTSKLYLILAYAVLPAVCEEFVYRGIVCYEYEKGGVIRAVIFSSLFFGLLHFNIINLPVYLFAGAILALTLYSTRSLFGAMIVHFFYNLFGIFGQPYMNALYRLSSSGFFVFLVALLFFISAIVFCAQASRLYKKYLYRGYSADYRQPVITKPEKIRASYLEVIKAPSAIACLVVYIIALIIAWL